MEQKVLSPTVQHGEETDLRAEVFRIGGDGSQSLGRGMEENPVEHLLVLESDGRDFFWHGENDMKVGHLEKFSLTILDPPGSGQGLTFWAVAIAARVECIPFVAAIITALQMAAQSGCPAHFDGGHDAPLPRGHRRAMSFAVGFAIAAEHIRHFQLRAIHEPRAQKC
jgi:hypothetical protein